jgi:hypothetical protein
MATQKKGYDPELQEAWRKELNIPVRSPRTGYEDIRQILIDLQLPRVFLREHSKTTDIVIRLECSSKQLSPVPQKAYFGNGITLPMVFDQVLSKVASKGRSRFSSELSTLGYKAYCQTWIRLFEILYLNQFHPAVNSDLWLTEFKNVLKRKRGRRRQEDARSFMKRFKFFFEHCEKLRDSIAIVVRRSPTRTSVTDAIGLKVKQSLWKEIAKIPGGVSILGGEAFLDIPYATKTKSPAIDNLESWKSRQLAIALLAIESGLNYQTVEKRVAKQGRLTSSRPH